LNQPSTDRPSDSEPPGELLRTVRQNVHTHRHRHYPLYLWATLTRTTLWRKLSGVQLLTRLLLTLRSVLGWVVRALAFVQGSALVFGVVVLLLPALPVAAVAVMLYAMLVRFDRVRKLRLLLPHLKRRTVLFVFLVAPKTAFQERNLKDLSQQYTVIAVGHPHRRCRFNLCACGSYFEVREHFYYYLTRRVPPGAYRAVHLY